MSKNGLISRLKAEGELLYFFDWEKGGPQAMLLQQKFQALDSEGGAYEDMLFLYTVCHGYTSEGIQVSYLFKLDYLNYCYGGKNDTVYYSDRFDYEWKGARNDSKYPPYQTDIVTDLTWHEYDTQAYELLMSNWDTFFEQDSARGVIRLKPEYMPEWPGGCLASEGWDDEGIIAYSAILNWTYHGFSEGSGKGILDLQNTPGDMKSFFEKQKTIT